MNNLNKEKELRKELELYKRVYLSYLGKRPLVICDYCKYPLEKNESRVEIRQYIKKKKTENSYSSCNYFESERLFIYHKNCFKKVQPSKIIKAPAKILWKLRYKKK